MALGCPECGCLITDAHVPEGTLVARHPSAAPENLAKVREAPAVAFVVETLAAALRKYADESYNGYNADGQHARAVLVRLGLMDA